MSECSLLQMAISSTKFEENMICLYAAATSGDPGVKSRICPPYPQRVVKGG